MKRYVTEFEIGGDMFGSGVFASSISVAERLCQKRGLNEKIIGTQSMTELNIENTPRIP